MFRVLEGRREPDGDLLLFDPCGRCTFYILEGSRQPDGDLLLFGFCRSALGPDCDELGYSSLRELVSVKGFPQGNWLLR